MTKKILIMGFSGSGKTTLARELQIKLNCPWFNGDKVREQFNDWDFSIEGRLRQANRLNKLIEECPNDPEYIIVDFVAPLQEMRDIINPDFIVWMDTIPYGAYNDTNMIFEDPTKYDFRVVTKSSEIWGEQILKEILEV